MSQKVSLFWESKKALLYFPIKLKRHSPHWAVKFSFHRFWENLLTTTTSKVVGYALPDLDSISTGIKHSPLIHCKNYCNFLCRHKEVILTSTQTVFTVEGSWITCLILLRPAWVNRLNLLCCIFLRVLFCIKKIIQKFRNQFKQGKSQDLEKLKL